MRYRLPRTTHRGCEGVRAEAYCGTLPTGFAWGDHVSLPECRGHKVANLYGGKGVGPHGIWGVFVP